MGKDVILDEVGQEKQTPKNTLRDTQKMAITNTDQFPSNLEAVEAAGLLATNLVTKGYTVLDLGTTKVNSTLKVTSIITAKVTSTKEVTYMGWVETMGN